MSEGRGLHQFGDSGRMKSGNLCKGQVFCANEGTETNVSFLGLAILISRWLNEVSTSKQNEIKEYNNNILLCYRFNGLTSSIIL